MIRDNEQCCSIRCRDWSKWVCDWLPIASIKAGPIHHSTSKDHVLNPHHINQARSNGKTSHSLEAPPKIRLHSTTTNELTPEGWFVPIYLDTRSTLLVCPSFSILDPMSVQLRPSHVCCLFCWWSNGFEFVHVVVNGFDGRILFEHRVQFLLVSQHVELPDQNINQT